MVMFLAAALLLVPAARSGEKKKPTLPSQPGSFTLERAIAVALKQNPDVLKAVQEGKKPLVDGHEGRKSVEIILAIYQSSWTGKRVSLPLKSDSKRSK